MFNLKVSHLYVHELTPVYPCFLFTKQHQLSLSMSGEIWMTQLSSAVDIKQSHKNSKYLYSYLSRADLLQALSQHDLQIKLFPQKTLIIDWEPFKLNNLANMEILGRRISDGYHIVVGTKSVAVGARAEYESLSFCTPYIADVGLCASLEYYGSDTEDVLQHLLLHLKKLKQKWFHGNLDITLYAPMSMSKDKLMQVVNGLPGVQVKELMRKDGTPLRLHYGASDLREFIKSIPSKL